MENFNLFDEEDEDEPSGQDANLDGEQVRETGPGLTNPDAILPLDSEQALQDIIDFLNDVVDNDQSSDIVYYRGRKGWRQPPRPNDTE